MDPNFNSKISGLKAKLNTRKIVGEVLPAFALAFAGVLGMTNADAAPPTSGPPIRTDLPAGQGCAFALTIIQEGTQPAPREFTDKNGNVVRVLTAGKGTINTYINAETGASITIKPGGGSVQRTTFNTDGTLTVVATGFNGLILFPSDMPAGPSSMLYIGRLVYTVDPSTGVFTLIGSSGKQTDICATLSLTS
jgi:hypothetical protein